MRVAKYVLVNTLSQKPDKWGESILSRRHTHITLYCPTAAVFIKYLELWGGWSNTISVELISVPWMDSLSPTWAIWVIRDVTVNAPSYQRRFLWLELLPPGLTHMELDGLNKSSTRIMLLDFHVFMCGSSSSSHIAIKFLMDSSWHKTTISHEMAIRYRHFTVTW